MDESRKMVDDEALKRAIEWELGRMPQEIRATFARRTIPNKAPGYMALLLVRMMRKHGWRIDGPVYSSEGAIVGRAMPPKDADGP